MWRIKAFVYWNAYESPAQCHTNHGPQTTCLLLSVYVLKAWFTEKFISPTIWHNIFQISYFWKCFCSKWALHQCRIPSTDLVYIVGHSIHFDRNKCLVQHTLHWHSQEHKQLHIKLTILLNHNSMRQKFQTKFSSQENGEIYVTGGMCFFLFRH